MGMSRITAAMNQPPPKPARCCSGNRPYTGQIEPFVASRFVKTAGGSVRSVFAGQVLDLGADAVEPRCAFRLDLGALGRVVHRQMPGLVGADQEADPARVVDLTHAGGLDVV